MLVSSSHRFIFVHIPKTAGTSITHALAPHCANPPFSTRAALLRSLPVRQSPDTAWMQLHDTARKIRQKLGQSFYDSCTSFAVVRNPFDHAVSHYGFLKTYNYKRIMRKVNAMSFETYLNWRLAAPHHALKTRVGLFAKLPDQSYFVVDNRGNLMVDRLLRFENLNHDFSVLANDLGIGAPQLDHRRRATNTETAKTRQGYYTPQTIRLIQTLYDRDFGLLGYDRTPEI